jgi:hypothetical protein
MTLYLNSLVSTQNSEYTRSTPLSPFILSRNYTQPCGVPLIIYSLSSLYKTEIYLVALYFDLLVNRLVLSSDFPSTFAISLSFPYHLTSNLTFYLILVLILKSSIRSSVKNSSSFLFSDLHRSIPLSHFIY